MSVSLSPPPKKKNQIQTTSRVLSVCLELHLYILHWHYFLMILLFSLFLSVLSPPPSCQKNFPLFTLCLIFNLLVCPFCKYLPTLLPVDILTIHFASVFLSPTLLTLQSFLIVKVLLPHSHLACPSLHSRCEPRVAPSPPRMPTSRTVDSWP